MGLDEERDRMCNLHNAREMVQRILEMDGQKAVVICCSLWRWWTARNKLNAEGKSVSVEEIWRQANYWVNECSLYCQKAGEMEDTAAAAPPPRWTRPPMDTVKLNIDGAFNAQERSGGWGFIARDDLGEARGAGAGCITHAINAIQTEATACFEALQAAVECGMGRIIIETDCTNLITALKSTEFDLATVGVIYRDIRSFILLNFSSVEFLYVPRSCNKIAHALAALGARQFDSRLTWLEEVPNDVQVLVASELAEPV